MLSGKTALITGASRGIGKAIAQEFAKNGADIAIIYAGNTEKATEVSESVKAMGRKCQIYKCDVSSFEQSKEAVSDIMKEFGRIDILVNNAGITKDGLILSMKETDYDSVLDTNLKGAFNMIKHCYSQFIKRRSGSIINISSVVGINGNAGQANYSAAKSGIIGLTKSVAKELGGRSIRCNAIAPGFIKTDMTAVIPTETAEEMQKNIPLKRLGNGEDVAKLALFLASENSSYITGEVIKVDGGLAI